MTTAARRARGRHCLPHVPAAKLSAMASLVRVVLAPLVLTALALAQNTLQDGGPIVQILSIP